MVNNWKIELVVFLLKEITYNSVQFEKSKKEAILLDDSSCFSIFLTIVVVVVKAIDIFTEKKDYISIFYVTATGPEPTTT